MYFSEAHIEGTDARLESTDDGTPMTAFELQVEPHQEPQGPQASHLHEPQTHFLMYAWISFLSVVTEQI